MILDSLNNYQIYNGIHKDWEKAFKVISDYLSKPIPEGDNVSVEQDGIKMVMQTYKTRAANEKKYEGHKKNIDIQFLVKGKEIIYYANSKGLDVIVPYSEERDHMSFADSDYASPLHLVPNCFAVFMPGEAHKTQCVWDEVVDAVKIIVKLPI